MPIAESVGATAAQIAALEAGDITASCFDAREQLVLQFTDELVNDVRVSDPTFAAATREFSSREVVELILAVGYYMMIARLLETTGVDLEAPAGGAILESLRS